MDCRRVIVAMGVWAIVCIACAVSVPPTGGPEDKAPPKISTTVPRADSTGVDPGSSIRIEFSEPMRRERIERLVSISPPIEFKRVTWEANTLVIEPSGELVRDTTYVVRVRPEYQDRHGVPGEGWKEFAFATGSAPLDTARIEGTLSLKRGPAGRAVARAYRVTALDTLDFEADRADREAIADKDGKFVLRYLPANGERFAVMAFLDENTNRIYNPDTDPAAVYADTLVLVSAAAVVRGVDMTLRDPKEPGTVKGTVTNESGIDSARVLVAMFEAADSTKAAYRAECDSTGAYQLSSVKPGEYTLRAFVDVKADSMPGVYPCATRPAGCREPSRRRPGTLKVEAGAVITEPALVIKREESP